MPTTETERHRPHHRRIDRHRRDLRRPSGEARPRPHSGRPQQAAARERWHAGSPTTPAGRSRRSKPISPPRRTCKRVEDILRTNAGISMLVNNAGVGATVPLLASDVDKMERHDRPERHGADPPDLCGGAGIRRPRQRHDHQHCIDRRDRAGDAERRLWRHQSLRARVHAIARSRARRQGRPRAGGAAGRNGHRVLGRRRQAGSPASGADRDVGRRPGRRRSGRVSTSARP